MLVILTVIYIYFLAAYPNKSGLFLAKNTIKGKSKINVDVSKIPNPLNSSSTLSLWIKYNNVNYRRGERKYIITKGDNNRNLEMPSISIDPILNKIEIVCDYQLPNGQGIQKPSITLDIPMKKWFNLTLLTKDSEIQVYLNGLLKDSIIVNGYPRFNDKDMLINYEGGFDGLLKNVLYFTSTLSSNNIKKLYYLGPYYDGTVTFIGFLLGTFLGKLFTSLFIPIKYFGKLLSYILSLVGIIDVSFIPNICDKDAS